MSDPREPPSIAHKGQRTRDKGQATAALIAALVGMALYAVTLGGTYIYDDVYHLFNDWRTHPRKVVRSQPAPAAATAPAAVLEAEYLPPAIEDPRAWHLYLTESYNDAVDNLYRPVTSLSYAVQATLHGRHESRAWAWHLFNVLLYGVVCAQVALLAGRMARADEEETVESILRRVRAGEDDLSSRSPAQGRLAGWIALCAGLLFAVHPVHVEVVAGIVGRAELICAAGFLGALLVITRPLTPLRILAFVALMLLSIGGKEQGLVLPAVALVWYLSRHWAGLGPLTRWVRPVKDASQQPAVEALQREGSRAADKTGSLPYAPANLRPVSQDLWKILFIAVALPLAGYLVLREQWLSLSMAWPKNLLDPTIQPMSDAAGLDRWLMPVALAGRYLALLAWPASLSIDYGSVVIEPPQRVGDPYLWLGFVAIALFVAAVVHAVRSRWAAGLTMLAGFAVTYGVVSNLPTIIGTVFGERLLFLPSAFFVIWLVMIGARVAGIGREPEGPRSLTARRARFARLALPIVLTLCVLGALRTFTYAARWNDRGTFYQYQSQVQPRSVRIWMLLGEELRQQGRLEEAAVAAAHATDLKPDYWSSWILRATVAEQRGLLEEAMQYATRAVEARTSMTTTAVLARIEGAYIRQRDRLPSTQPAQQPQGVPD